VKPYVKIAALCIAVVAVMLILYVMKETSKPESGIIAEERARFARSKDNSRAEQDVLYATSFDNKLRFIDYRLAAAYNSENRPDDAIAILQRIIKEESQEKNGIPLRSSNYSAAAQYYEALARSYELKQDPDNMKKATQSRGEMLSAALESKKKEDLEEGKLLNTHE
jgi:predicted Zn-dependent protease